MSQFLKNTQTTTILSLSCSLSSSRSWSSNLSKSRHGPYPFTRPMLNIQLFCPLHFRCISTSNKNIGYVLTQHQKNKQFKMIKRKLNSSHHFFNRLGLLLQNSLNEQSKFISKYSRMLHIYYPDQKKLRTHTTLANKQILINSTVNSDGKLIKKRGIISNNERYYCDKSINEKILGHKIFNESTNKEINEQYSPEEGGDKQEHNSTKSDVIENDPELKNILKEIRNDFNGNNNAQDFSDNFQTISERNSIEKCSDYSYFQVAEDIEEYDYKDENEILHQIQPEKSAPISLERGKSGVFDLEEFLIFMNDLGAENIVTIVVPPEANFCDHMIVASTKSMRHMKAIQEELMWVHKRKKSAKDDHLIISGVDNYWSAMDLGNIVLHLFYGDAREFYDIESLWTLGPDADPKCQDQQSNKYDLSAEDLFWKEAEQLKKESDNPVSYTENGADLKDSRSARSSLEKEKKD